MISRRFLNRKTFIADIFGNNGLFQFWEVRFLHGWLPLLLGLGFGVLLAFLAYREDWHFLIAAIFIVPAAMLLSRYPFAAILIWILVFPFFVRTPAMGGRYIYWMLHRALIPVTLGFVVLTHRLGVRKKVEPLRPGLAELAMVVFLVLALLNIFLFSPDTEQNIYHLFDHIFIPFCAYWLVRLIAPKEADMKRLLWVAIFTVVVQVAIGLLGWYAPQALPGQWISRQGSRTTGTFGNPAVYSSTLIFFALLLFQQATQTGSGKIRAVLLSVFTLGFFGVFFTFSRGSWLAGVVVLLGLMLLYPKTTLRLTLITAVLGIILGSSLLANEVSWARRRLDAEETAEGRIILLNTGLKMVEEKPLFGWGYGNYDRYDNQFKTAVGEIIVRSDSTSHNTYLTVMAEMGLIAFLFYVFPLVYWLVYSMKSWQWLPQRGFWSRRLLFILWLVIIAHIVVSNFMDMIRFNEFGTTMWWLTLGLIASMVYPLQRSDDLRVP
jgi:O-antigen ligase